MKNDRTLKQSAFYRSTISVNNQLIKIEGENPDLAINQFKVGRGQNFDCSGIH